MAIVKPDISEVWASGGDKIKPSDVKIQTGWSAEIPPYQWENYIQHRQDEMLAYLNERGIPEWDNRTDYLAGGKSYVQGSDGVVYKSIAASGPATTVQDPTTDVSDTYWAVAFASTTQASETVQGVVELATTAEAQTGADDVRAMTALKVKQAIDQFAGDDFLNAQIATVAAAGTLDLTAGAPDTSQLVISGTGVNINGFTVTADRFFVVKIAGGSNTLVNSASLVTGRGENIPVASGDCFLMRSTAANTVEIVGGSFLIDRSIGSGQTWQDLTASRALSVTYTNTSGRPIYVAVTCQSTDSLTNGVFVDGVRIQGQNDTQNNQGRNFSFVVPNGSTYNAVGFSLQVWVELR